MAETFPRAKLRPPVSDAILANIPFSGTTVAFPVSTV